MPRSATGKIEKKMRDQIYRGMQRRVKLMNKAYSEALDTILTQTVDDCNLIFKSAIDDFYSYSTHIYQRYEVGVGTETGVRLYYGKQIYNDKANKKLSIGWDGEDMPSSYEFHSNDAVMDMVMKGTRFYRPKYTNSDGDTIDRYRMLWVFNEKIATSIGTIKRRTPNAAFDEYIKEWHNVMPTRFEDRAKRIYKSYLKG